MSTITAIPTRYAGCHFRSRLEARWAVYFDHAGIRWEYEPQGFVDNRWDDISPDHYLPDFHLPDTNTWVEVKGGNAALRRDIATLEPFLDWNSPLPGMQESWGTDRGLLLLGSIPRTEGMSKDRHIVHQIIQHHEGLMTNWWSFAGGGVCYNTGDGLQINELDVETTLTLKDACPENSWRLPSWSLAYMAARSARFEHGQSGAT